MGRSSIRGGKGEGGDTRKGDACAATERVQVNIGVVADRQERSSIRAY